MTRITDLETQIEHLRKKHYNSPGAGGWINELEGKLLALRSNPNKRKVYKPCLVHTKTRFDYYSVNGE